jgi:hypothetical protein
MPKEPSKYQMPSVLHTHEGKLPEMHDWEIGKKYAMRIEGEYNSHNASGEGKHTGSFEINKIDPEVDEDEEKGGDKEQEKGETSESEPKKAKSEGKKEDKESDALDEKTKKLSAKFEKRKY